MSSKLKMDRYDSRLLAVEKREKDETVDDPCT